MAIVKRANAISVASIMMHNATSGVADKLKEFCVRKAVEFGIISKTYPHKFSMDNPNEGRKTITRIKTLLMKHLVKCIPYLTFSQEEFLQIHDRDCLTVHLYNQNYPEGPDLSIYDWETNNGVTMSHYKLAGSSSYRSLFLENFENVRSLRRYCRYINYILRKNYIPIKLDLMADLVYDNREYYAVKQLTSEQRGSSVIPANVSVKIKISFVQWICGGSGYDRFLSASKDGVQDDNLFSNTNFWTNNTLHHSSMGAYPDFYKYSFEKIFLNLDKAISMLNTLTRKVRYGSSAFSIRDIPGS
jgi:hypothetical protein